jgi:hypothetical protein
MHTFGLSTINGFSIRLVFLASSLIAALPATSCAGDIDSDPIRYSTNSPDNAVSRLQKRIDSGNLKLAWESRFGYLRSVLRALAVPESSQMLVFSKTSFQRDRIGPRTPRAIYFNDEMYVGFCQKGSVMELSAVDPKLGAVFYTLEQKPATEPRFVRQDDSCLICHGSSRHQGFPGHLVRSVYPDAGGYPILSFGSHHTDHTSPLEERWGGWYVTGTSGMQKHLGNVIGEEGQRPDLIDNSLHRNLTDLGKRFSKEAYLSPHSDIVALMVLEHQTEMHNRLTRAGFLTRIALFEEAEINKSLGRPPGYRSESTTGRIKSAGEPVVQYLLFSGEAQLTSPIAGTSTFARDFSAQGPRDHDGRSLRDLDLTTRLFRYPLSYLIYTDAFDALPEEVRDYIYHRLWDVLTQQDKTPAFANLSSKDRRSILEILVATKPNLPEYWRAGHHAKSEQRSGG